MYFILLYHILKLKYAFWDVVVKAAGVCRLGGMGSMWRTGLTGHAVVNQWQHVKDWFDWSTVPCRWTWSVPVLSGPTMDTAPTETATWSPAQRSEVNPSAQYSTRYTEIQEKMTCSPVCLSLSVCLLACLSIYFQSMIPVGIKSGNFNKVGLLTQHVTVNAPMLF